MKRIKMIEWSEKQCCQYHSLSTQLGYFDIASKGDQKSYEGCQKFCYNSLICLWQFFLTINLILVNSGRIWTFFILKSILVYKFQGLRCLKMQSILVIPYLHQRSKHFFSYKGHFEQNLSKVALVVQFPKLPICTFRVIL